MRIRVKKAIAIVLAGIMSLVVVGCDGSKEQTTKEEFNIEENQEMDAVINKYAENKIEVNNAWTSYGGLFQLDGGSIEYLSANGIFYSKDNGNTWSKENAEWYDEINGYFVTAAVAADGTTAVTYNDDSESDFAPVSIIVHPDGTKTDVVIPSDYSGDCTYFYSLTFNSDGRLFGSLIGTDSIFEIDTVSGQISKYLDEKVVLINACNDYLFIAGYEQAKIYDIKSDRYIEDQVLNDFISKTVEGFEFWGESNVNAYPFWSNSNEGKVIYIMCDKGLYRHVIGGEMFECIIEPEATVMSIPEFVVSSVIEHEDENGTISFLQTATNGIVYKYSYDSEKPTVTSDKLVVYSLEENSSIKNAVYIFMRNHPEIEVDYQVGMQSDSITKEDAIKNLNTKIVNGDGPDVLVLDSLPVKKYEEKGIFLDISKEMEIINSETPLFYNMVKPFYRGDKLFTIPSECSFFTVYGLGESVPDQIDGIEELKHVFEVARDNKKESDLVGICSAKGILKALFPVCAPSWTDQKGQIDTKKIEEYYTYAKEIYDIQMNGTPESRIKLYEDVSRYIEKEYNISSKEDAVDYVESNFMDYARYNNVMGIDMVSSFYDYMLLKSYDKIEELESTKVIIMNGQCSDVYCPKTIVGVTTQTADNGRKTIAIEFIKELLGNESQSMLEDSFGINKASIDTVYEKQKSEAKDGMVGSICTGEGNGVTFSFNVFLPTKQELDNLKTTLANLNVPYIQDKNFDNKVIEEGVDLLDGRESMEQALYNVQNKLTIYLSE